MSTKQKRELTPKQIKVRNIMGWVVSALCIALIIAALVVSIVTISNTTKSNGQVSGLFGKANMVVKTDSMESTIMTHDFIVVELVDLDEAMNLEIGQVITYRRIENGRWILVTHRISDYIVSGDGSRVGYIVVGDNPNPKTGEAGTDNVYCTDVLGKWGTPAEQNADGTFNITKETEGANLGQIGKLINFIQEDKTNYFLVVVLPLIVIFLIYVFILVRSLVIAKIDKTKEEALATAGVDGLSEEDKRRLAEEYLAQLARENAVKADADNTADNNTLEDQPLDEENTDKGDEQA